MKRGLMALAFILLILVPAVSGAGGVAPSGASDRIEVGVQRSFGNWLEIQLMGLWDLNPFDEGDQLESKGVTRVG